MKHIHQLFRTYEFYVLSAFVVFLIVGFYVQTSTPKNPLDQRQALHSYSNERLGFSLLIPYIGSNDTPIKVRDSEVDGTVAFQYDRDIYGLRGGWTFIVEPVPSEADLVSVITDRILPPDKYSEYDDSELCRIREIIPTAYPETFTIALVEGPKTPDSETRHEGCGSASKSWIIKYSPTFQKIAFIYIGEGNSYSLTRNGQTVVYDSAIADSFHFVSSAR